MIFTDEEHEALIELLDGEPAGHGPVKTLADMSAEERDEMVRLYGPISKETLKSLPRRHRRRK